MDNDPRASIRDATKVALTRGGWGWELIDLDGVTIEKGMAAVREDRLTQTRRAMERDDRTMS
jgi:hypothetical protein